MEPPPGDPTETPALCVCDDDSFWPWHRWTEFRDWPGKADTVVVLPVAGTADWGLGHPLDSEETVLLALVRDACRRAPAERRHLVLPPVRFVLGPDPSCAFAVDAPTAHSAVAEVVASVAAAGFSRIAIVNASPWNEELLAAAARDLRIARGLHLFLVHLSALGLDFHPVRSRSRRTLQTVLTSLYGREPGPVAGEGETPASWGTEPVTRLAGTPLALAEARAEAGAVLGGAGAHLARLLSEIRERPPVAVHVRPI
jgi:hypothetical protein